MKVPSVGGDWSIGSSCCESAILAGCVVFWSLVFFFRYSNGKYVD
jgi:hypothetical protein